MQITGHKTRAMFDRYNIVSESDRTEAAAKLTEYRRQRTASETCVKRRSDSILTDTISDTVAINKKGD